MSSLAKLTRNYYWTWDHSTNWHLPADGQQEDGCNNLYLKSADDFVRDYQLLVDHCVRMRVPGIVIWGFCRDAHGGVKASQKVCDYASIHGVRILPGVGTSVYGGVYYVTDNETDSAASEFTAKHLVQHNPEVGLVGHDGKTSRLYPCPTHPKTIDWLQRCARWLFGTFRIGGVNLEHGDFIVCFCERCRAARAGQRQPAYFSTMHLANRPFLDEALRIQPDAWITYATYTGFCPDPSGEKGYTPADAWQIREPWRLHGADPEFARDLDERSICQWTLSDMVNEPSVPLAAWLDEGRPAAMLRSAHWPAGAKPPAKHSVGFLHQGSQWRRYGAHLAGITARYTLQLSAIKEACLRAVEAGLEGVAIHGEVSPRCIPWELNYLAHSFFSEQPGASLREFGRACVGAILGSEAEGEHFVELLAKAESGICSHDELADLDKCIAAALKFVQTTGKGREALRHWRWLRVAAEPGQWKAAQVYQVTA